MIDKFLQYFFTNKPTGQERSFEFSIMLNKNL